MRHRWAGKCCAFADCRKAEDRISVCFNTFEVTVGGLKDCYMDLCYQDIMNSLLFSLLHPVSVQNLLWESGVSCCCFALHSIFHKTKEALVPEHLEKKKLAQCFPDPTTITGVILINAAEIKLASAWKIILNLFDLAITINPAAIYVHFDFCFVLSQSHNLLFYYSSESLLIQVRILNNCIATYL